MVTCRLMKEGAVLEEEDIPLAANGQESRYIEEMFTFTGADVRRISWDRCAARCQPRGRGCLPEWRWRLDEGNRILTTLPVVPVPERMSQE